MIKLYTNEKHIPQEKEFVYLNDNLFNGEIYDRELADTDLEIMLIK